MSSCIWHSSRNWQCRYSLIAGCVYMSWFQVVTHSINLPHPPQQAQARSPAYFISQPSPHGNLLLPVIPRFDSSGQLKWTSRHHAVPITIIHNNPDTSLVLQATLFAEMTDLIMLQPSSYRHSRTCYYQWNPCSSSCHGVACSHITCLADVSILSIIVPWW